MLKHRLFGFNSVFLINHHIKVMGIDEGKIFEGNKGIELFKTKTVQVRMQGLKGTVF